MSVAGITIFISKFCQKVLFCFFSYKIEEYLTISIFKFGSSDPQCNVNHKCHNHFFFCFMFYQVMFQYVSKSRFWTVFQFVGVCDCVRWQIYRINSPHPKRSKYVINLNAEAASLGLFIEIWWKKPQSDMTWFHSVSESLSLLLCLMLPDSFHSASVYLLSWELLCSNMSVASMHLTWNWLYNQRWLSVLELLDLLISWSNWEKKQNCQIVSADMHSWRESYNLAHITDQIIFVNT